MINRLLDTLNKVGLNLNGEEIADILWLALQMHTLKPEQTDQVNQLDIDSKDVSSLTHRATNSEILSSPPQFFKKQILPVKKTEPSAPLYTKSIETLSGGKGSFTFKVLSASSLQEPLELAKALRPLMRRVLSDTEMVLDEVATAERIAEEKIFTPVLKPAPKRWFDLVLIADDTPSMGIWRRTIFDLQRLLERHGAFRDVQTWGLLTNEKGQIRLRSGIGAAARGRRLRSPNELVDPSGQRLFLVVSDCVSSMWRDSSITQALAPWVKSGPLAIVQMLPEQLWERTSLGLSVAVQLRSLSPGAPNQKLIAEGIASWDDVDLKFGLKIPVITLEPEPSLAWAQMVVGVGGAKSTGFIIEVPHTVPSENNVIQNEQVSPPLSVEQRVHRFLNAASPIARNLAGLLAAAPVISLPIVRLIQTSMLKQSRQVHVAEVLLGGILKPQSPIDVHTDPDYVQYNFIDEKIRSILLDASPLSSSTKVLREVSDFVAKRAGLSLQQFEAILQDPTLPKTDAIGDQVRPFALVTAQVLKRLGGDYLLVAKRLEQQFENQQEEAVNVKSSSQLYALLIGIDCYLPNMLPQGGSYKSLAGCVHDINHVGSFLINVLQVPPANILKLTASNSDSPNVPQEPSEQLPTYENIVAKFKQLTDLAQPQDQIYIHYSGHGGRSTTIYPDLKGSDGIDESLVPTDIGNSEARYLRDVELAKLLQNMVDKGLVVTLVLDSCYSGGAKRGEVNDANIRSLNKNIIDTTPRPTESLVASTEELIQNWQQLTQGQQNTRNVTAASGWLPEPKGYVLLAACRDNESAYEYAFDGKERNGALTYWLLDSLQKLGNDCTLKVLHDRILAKINSQFQQQTPMLQGEGDRLIFGGKSTKSQSAVLVKKVDVAKNQVLLQAGEAQGLRKGAEFAIYQLGTTDFSQTDKRVALAKVVKVRAEESIAEITKILRQEKPGNSTQQTLSQGTIEDGASAIMLSPSVKLVRKVRLLPALENQQLPKEMDYKEALAAVKAVKENVEGNGWVEFLSDDEPNDEPVTYQVSVNAEDEYEILDAGGELINLRFPLKVSEPNSAASVVNCLVHLSKYQATLQLDNNDPISSFTGKLKVDICLPGENNGELLPLNAPGNVPTFDVDENAILRIRNESTNVLNITVLTIQADWSISQLYPEGAGAFEPLDPGREKLIRIHTSLCEGYNESADVLKVFATVGATNFRWLELPALDKPPKGTQVFRVNNPPEELFAAVTSEQPLNLNAAVTSEQPLNLNAAVASTQPSKGGIGPPAYPSEKWTTEQVKIIVRKND